MEIEGVKLVKREDAFILDIEGAKAIGISLPTTTVKEIAGETSVAPEGGKVGGKYGSGTEQKWLLMTNKETLIRNYDHLTVMAAKALTHASGSTVQPTDISTFGATGPASFGIGMVLVERKKEEPQA
jgi:hypothetical protein